MNRSIAFSPAQCDRNCLLQMRQLAMRQNIGEWNAGIGRAIASVMVVCFVLAWVLL